MSIRMTPFEALYRRRCMSPIQQYESGEKHLEIVDFNRRATENVRRITKRFDTVHSRQKSYADKRRRPIEFQVGDLVFLKVVPMKGRIRFGKRGKLNPRYIGPFKILKRINKVAYIYQHCRQNQFMYITSFTY